VIYRIDIRQGTDAWREWRHRGLGASDAPALLDLCPASWSPRPTPASLYAEKVALELAESPPSYAMRRGQSLEGVARHILEAERGQEYQPVCVEHPSFGWLGRAQNSRPQPTAHPPPTNGVPRKGRSREEVLAEHRKRKAAGGAA